MKDRKYYDDAEYNKYLRLHNSKKYKSAMHCLKNYLEKFPYDMRACTSYVGLLIRHGRLEEAEDFLDNIVITKKVIEKNVYEINYTRIKLLCCQGKYEECYSLVQENQTALSR